MAENSLDIRNNNMEANKDDDTAVEMETTINSTKNLDMTIDFAMGKAIADFLGKSKGYPKSLTKPSSEPEIAQIMHIRDYKKDAAVCRELSVKLKCMIEENSSNLQEKIQLLHDVIDCVGIEKQRNIVRRVVTLNRRHGQLKKIWSSRGLPVDEKSLQSAASKDVFDMSSLDESLPSKSDKSDAKKKAEKVAKEYISLLEQKRRSFRKSEILRILASNAPEPNKNSSSKHHQSRSLTRMVKKVCGEVKNVRIFSFRPLIKRRSNSSVDSKRVSCPELRELHASHKDERNEKTQDLDGESRFQNGPLQSEEVTYKLGREMVVLLKSPCANTGKTRSDKRKDDSNTANNLRNPERLLFNRDQQDDEQHRSASLRTQHLHDSISLCRQLSRLKIANSRRGEGMDESEIEEASADQNKDKQEKVAIANRRREVVERLRERYRRYQQDAQALKKN